ncbi:MAG: hypothetical protein JRM72_08380 [Nitrososphaerota archaeon]|jgi:hypothetical protein|nr:hypothetical protein [Nitrososphaerota archaeon]
MSIESEYAGKIKMKCPIHGIDMEYIGYTLNTNWTLNDFWLCHKQHIVMVNWAKEITYFMKMEGRMKR